MTFFEKSKNIFYENTQYYREKTEYALILFLVFKTDKVILSVFAGSIFACVLINAMK
jgi:hypothetical protein